MPLVRIWHGGVPLERADEYERFLIERACSGSTSPGGTRATWPTSSS